MHTELNIGLALGSGSSRGWSHIGILKALSGLGITPDIICGTSIGALVGASCVSDKLEKLEAWAEDQGHSMAELAEAWLLAQPAVCSVISGATRVEHVQANARAADWQLSADDLSQVNSIL